MLIPDHDAVLEQIQQDKSTISLLLEQVRSIDNELEKHWGIVFPKREVHSWLDLVVGSQSLCPDTGYRQRLARVRRQLQAAGFGFGYADVVGGLGEIPLEFSTEGVIVLVKAGRRKYPQDYRALMESEWD